MTIEFKLPELGENVESGDVVNVLVAEGDQIDANQPICELETDKAVIEIPCTYAGKVAKVHFKKGDTVKVGQTLVTLEADDKLAAKAPEADAKKTPAAEEKRAPAPEPTPVAAAEPSQPSTGGPIPAGPAARRLARELGVDLQRLSGSGSRGRITPEDVRSASAAGGAVGLPGGQPAGMVRIEPVVPPGEPSSDSWGTVRRDKMSKIRRTIAAQMVRSASTIPHVTNFDDADVTDLEMLRKGVPKGYLGENVKLTMMPFLLKAVAVALRRHPALNASLDDEKEEVVYKEYVHLGVAVDTPRGLVVPKLRDVDRMSIPEIARALVTVAEKARAVDFSIDDLRGGTFTISNLGAVGGTYSTPIINHPEVAILLVGRSRWLPVIREGNVEPRMMMPLSLSYDHRLVDGATAGRFLNEVIDLLQSPGKLLLLG
jgi:pyruvate dehydrogenase E2 component (dihydrolipoamide acetyltransferase)